MIDNGTSIYSNPSVVVEQSDISFSGLNQRWPTEIQKAREDEQANVVLVNESVCRLERAAHRLILLNVATLSLAALLIAWFLGLHMQWLTQ